LDQGAVLKHKIDYSIALLLMTRYFLHKFNNIFVSLINQHNHTMKLTVKKNKTINFIQNSFQIAVLK
ncbi:MAG: hypothetical protein E6889_02675, partial [Staphylococcus epidermidis]|nr:hypothetical protein [Staphylococcus epidermidis]